MAWYRCMGSNGGGGGGQGGLSDLHVNPYNVENGSYLLVGNAIEYTVSAQAGYEGMSVQLLDLEVGHQYLISFDVELMNVPIWAGSYSWKTCVANGNITNYNAGNYGQGELSEGQYELPTTATKKSYGFLVTPQSAMTTLLFLTANAAGGQTASFYIDNFKMADLSGEVENHMFNTVQLLDSYSRGSNNATASVTSKSFNVKANNTVMIAVMHRASITVPSGFNLVKESQVLNGAQSIAVYSKYFTSDYTGTFVVTNSDSSKRISVFVFQFNSKIKIEEWFEDYWDDTVSESNPTTYTLNLIKKPMLLLCHSLYAGSGQVSWTMQDNALVTTTDDNVSANVWLNNWDEINIKTDGRMDAFLNLNGNAEVSNTLLCYNNYNGVLGFALTDELYNGGSGEINAPTKFWQGLQSQYDALVSYESDRMYTIVATINQMSDTMSGYINKISKIYIGDTLVYPVEEQGYDWCITDYFLPDNNASTNGDNRDYDVNVGVYFQSDANKNRDWQIEFKATLSTGSYSSSDQVLFGQGNNSSARLKEVYFNASGNLYISGNSISDIEYISDANGHDIKMIYSNTNGTIELYKDGTLVNTITGVPTSYSAANYELGLCRYKSSYRFHGTINYFKFKWLS